MFLDSLYYQVALLILFLVGKLTFNQHPLLNVAGGTLVGPDSFKLFVRESPLFKNWMAVKQGLMSLGIHDKTPGVAAENSLVLKGSIGLPASLQSTNAIEARHPGTLQQLTADGKWHTNEKQANASLAPKNNPYG